MIDGMPRMWFKPADSRGEACLFIECKNGPKRFQRIWMDEFGWIKHTPAGLIDWAWNVAETGTPLIAGDQ